MSDNKVVRFPRPSEAWHEKSKAFSPAPLQPSLFDHAGANRGRIVFLDIIWLAEDTLLNIVVRNGVTDLVDLRPRPVFERPRFRHRQVVHYLYERNVGYLEYAMLARRDRNTSFNSSWSEGIEIRFREMLTRGLTLCLYDDGARSAGWVDDVRHLVDMAPDYLAEVHPRALVGAPEVAERR
ncbi:MAG TPA: hypothetical protein VGN91_10290 [Bosea sp. (in: a-proteobacteria)]|jgi:hypothetical protein|nr:hypothetical protein [Bosea sp. (in: a-proteobacteria)]